MYGFITIVVPDESIFDEGIYYCYTDNLSNEDFAIAVQNYFKDSNIRPLNKHDNKPVPLSAYVGNGNSINVGNDDYHVYKFTLINNCIQVDEER